MSANPLVTIMIPTYNQAAFLEKAIESALAQDYENLEVVISDDNSVDNTPLLLERYSNNPRVRYSRNEHNLGRVKNYKHLLEDLAIGEWVINLDGDDYFTDTHFIKDAVDLTIRPTGNIVFVQGGHEVKTPAGKLLYTSLPSIEADHKMIDGRDYFLGFHHFSHMATLYRRETAIAIDFYRYDILSTDIESFLRLALHGKVILMKRIAGVWLHHGTNASQRLSIESLEKNMLRITGPAAYAISVSALPERIIRRWKQSKLNGYIFHYLTVYFANKKSIPGYPGHVIKKHPSPYLLKAIPLAFLKGTRKKYGQHPDR
jgi:glycosyltransferase involved in cell wall biosynthesis